MARTLSVPRLKISSKGMERSTVHLHIPSSHKAERAVKTFKDGMKKMPTESLQEKMTIFLFMYQNTQHATTSVTAAELLLAQSQIET